jgi:glycosyltransferase involved in cell wall biosynthesis
MARETAKYTSKDVTVIPFGVSTGSFEGVKPTSLFANDTVVVGTIKTLEKDYAIDVLIKAFAIALASNPDVNLKLLICGKGTMEEALKDLTRELQIEEHVLFTGYIGHDEVPGYLAGMDIFCCFSNAESFGVAVVEAMAAGKPTAVSNAGGLPEVVDHGECGLIVETQDPEAAASAISKLIGDGNLRTYLGAKAKERVTREYDWNNCVKSMVSIYNSNKAG